VSLRFRFLVKKYIYIYIFIYIDRARDAPACRIGRLEREQGVHTLNTGGGGGSAVFGGHGSIYKYI